MLCASLHNTAAPTILRAGEKINVILSVAEAEVDCRLVPGQTVDDLLSEIKAIVGDDVEIEVLRTSPGVESSWDTPLCDTTTEVMNELEPGCVTAPSMSTGATDSRYLAWKGGKACGL